MATTIKANNLIDSLLPEYDDLEQYSRSIPRGSYIGETGPLRIAYDKWHISARRIALVADVLGASVYDLDRLIRAARKWYARTNWARCLSDEDANRLFSLFVKQR